MKKRKIYHITTREDGGWDVKLAGADRVSSTHRTKDEAISHGRKIAKAQQPSQLVIHKMNSKIQVEYTYGKDPYPPVG
jgi:hypothetical protein